MAMAMAMAMAMKEGIMVNISVEKLYSMKYR